MRRSLIFAALYVAAVLALSAAGLAWRLAWERSDRDVAMLVDVRDLPSLGAADALPLLIKKGVRGIMVSELTGDDVIAGLAPVRLENAGVNASRLVPVGAADAYIDAALLKPDSVRRGSAAEFPVPIDALRRSGLVPDFAGLETASAHRLPIFYRVAPASTRFLPSSLESARRILSEYKDVALVSPSGEVAVGYPDMRPLASLIKEFKRDGAPMPTAQVEFSRQMGAAALTHLMFPHILPIHSVTNEELMSRNISRAAMLDRMVRAAVERGVRLLMMRPAPSGSAASALDEFAAEVEALAKRLTDRGFRMAWPKSSAGSRGPLAAGASALACSLVLAVSSYRFARRFANCHPSVESVPTAVKILAIAVGIAAAARFSPAMSRALGALTAAMLVTEASLIAMDGGRITNLCLGVAFAAVGGTAIAALFSEPLYTLRLAAFSGVKLTLALPPLLVILHDMKRRIHPESLTTLMSRPPLFGELFLAAGLLGLLALILFRSGNVEFIPGFEAAMRHGLEKLMVARPRSREVFIGYPCALLLFFAVKHGLWARWRELLRVGVVLGFSSVVNSFCHYHTPLAFIFLREFNGLWMGLLLGAALVLSVRFAILPLWRRVRFAAE